MKRSETNTIYAEAKACFAGNGWALPPNPKLLCTTTNHSTKN